MIVVHNHEPRVRTIPGPYAASPDGAGVATPFTITLKPGANQVDEQMWDQVAGYKTVKTLLDLKHLEVKAFKAQTFDHLSTEDATALVSETLDRDKLRAWADAETRSKVKGAISAQLKKLHIEQAKEN